LLINQANRSVFRPWNQNFMKKFALAICQTVSKKNRFGVCRNVKITQAIK